jgi:beta-lactamase regulating signal transducer with metallopeptidase domain
MIALLMKVTVVVAVGLSIATFVRRLGSEQRHLVLLATIVTALMLPLGIALSPRWSPPILPARQSGPATPYFSSTAPRPPEAALTFAPAARPVASRENTGSLGRANVDRRVSIVPILWALGALAVLAWIVAGHLRIALITRRAWVANAKDWTTLLDSERAKAGIERRVRLFITPEVSTPLTWGIGKAVVLLPEDALDWPASHRSVVLRHELAHVARRDTLAQLVAGVTCAVYWFHPLVWLTARRLRAECERACDDRVLSSGTTAADYALHLLLVARTANTLGTPGFVALAMARSSRLEGRVRAILDSTRRRSTLTRRAHWSAGILSILAVFSISAFRPVARLAPATLRLQPLVVTAAVPERLNLITAVANARPIALDTTIERSVPARLGGKLTIRLIPSGGNVTIRGWGESRIEVRGKLGGRNGPETQVSLTEVAGGAELLATYPGKEGNTSFSNAFDIRVPRRYDVDIKSAGGMITITDVQGTFSGSTGGGDIRVTRAKGTMHLGTGGGEVTVSNSDLHGMVSTGGGRVNFEGVAGGLVGSSGSEDVLESDAEAIGGESVADIPRDKSTTSTTTSATTSTSTVTDGDPDAAAHFVQGGIQRYRSGGPIVLDSAPNGARVTTGGGEIRIGRSAGDVFARTGGGRISIGPAAGSVVASTGAGDIVVTFEGGGAHSADITSGHGAAHLTLPSDISATLILESAYTNNLGHKTRIESDYPLTTTETEDWDASVGTPRRYVRSRIVLGKGDGVIRVRVVNGNVVVRRAATNG